jgi:hypothetical protein
MRLTGIADYKFLKAQDDSGRQADVVLRALKEACPDVIALKAPSDRADYFYIEAAADSGGE